jgi:hypothetical protein
MKRRTFLIVENTTPTVTKTDGDASREMGVGKPLLRESCAVIGRQLALAERLLTFRASRDPGSIGQAAHSFRRNHTYDGHDCQMRRGMQPEPISAIVLLWIVHLSPASQVIIGNAVVEGDLDYSFVSIS